MIHIVIPGPKDQTSDAQLRIGESRDSQERKGAPELDAYASPRNDALSKSYLTTPDVNPALRRGGLISFFRKHCASLPA